MHIIPGPIAGALCRRWGCRNCTIAGGVTMFLGLMLTVFSPNLYCVYLSFGVICGKCRSTDSEEYRGVCHLGISRRSVEPSPTNAEMNLPSPDIAEMNIPSPTMPRWTYHLLAMPRWTYHLLAMLRWTHHLLTMLRWTYHHLTMLI